MPSLLDTVTNMASGGLAQLIKTVADEIRLSPEAKAQLQQALSDNQVKLAQMQTDLEAKITDAASKNITAEAESGDKYTARARPSLMYMIEAVLGINYGLMALARLIPSMRAIQPLDLPSPLLWLFGSCILGYTGARSWDKFMGDNTQATSLSIPFLGVNASATPK